ncbi:hypothetical protein PCH_Pc22g26250 [Penicillium rubens Wisconsin 54-1255]|uniref:DUF4219 domain-containing protein n=1 Tax=Penicillium rubens (strain ATCC 28089 / DSM 1075 / NRRL 1951 / Wisconsin 54-1255) TaxID=500485 RepID=B6HTF0_PENRW|nr:hypothetical protein PCH_Pc22g26250 [Penicillium rubens Wisconsin 54-1255]
MSALVHDSPDRAVTAAEPLTGSDNFAIWKRLMTSYLKARQVWDVVSGDLERPVCLFNANKCAVGRHRRKISHLGARRHIQIRSYYPCPAARGTVYLVIEPSYDVYGTLHILVKLPLHSTHSACSWWKTKHIININISA